jgi:Immunity protein 42
MSIFGDKSLFAIEYEHSCGHNSHTYIHFRFWAGGQEIGDYEDIIYLSDCLCYLSDFLKLSNQRYEPELEQKSREDIFRIIYDSCMVTLPDQIRLEDILSNNLVTQESNPQKFNNIQERFHLDSIGMSSFQDRFNIILIEDRSGNQRLIWRTLSDMKIYEVNLPFKTFETVANQFLIDANAYLNTI